MRRGATPLACLLPLAWSDRIDARPVVNASAVAQLVGVTGPIHRAGPKWFGGCGAHSVGVTHRWVEQNTDGRRLGRTNQREAQG